MSYYGILYLAIENSANQSNKELLNKQLFTVNCTIPLSLTGSFSNSHILMNTLSEFSDSIVNNRKVLPQG